VHQGLFESLSVSKGVQFLLPDGSIATVSVVQVLAMCEHLFAAIPAYVVPKVVPGVVGTSHL